MILQRGIFMKKHDIFYAFDANGKKKKYECLAVFRIKSYGRTYMAFTDNIPDHAGHRKTYISAYNAESDDLCLRAINSLQEWKDAKETYYKNF